AVPDEWGVRALRECAGADRLLRSGIPEWIRLEACHSAQSEPLLAAALKARSAFDEFRCWLIRDVVPAPAADCACGSDLFDVLLARGHWCPRRRQDLLHEATAALDEALARLQQQAYEAAPGGWAEVQERLAADHPSPADYLATYQRLWDACRDRAEAMGLVTW